MVETEREAALLREQSVRLRDLLVEYVPLWAVSVVETRAPGSDASTTVHDHAASSVVPELVRLLEADIDDQWASPLEVVRTLVPMLTAELDALGADPVVVDPRFSELHPGDTYGLTPATFADVHPDLHEPGLAWGAAKAHVHLRRHAGKPSIPVVVVFAPDLGDRTKFDGFTVTHVRSAGKLFEFAAESEPDLVIVDLDRTSAPSDFRIDNAHVVGFGSHVDTDRHDAALEAGFDAVMARSIFFRRLPELLAPVAKVRA